MPIALDIDVRHMSTHKSNLTNASATSVQNGSELTLLKSVNVGPYWCLSTKSW